MPAFYFALKRFTMRYIGSYYNSAITHYKRNIKEYESMIDNIKASTYIDRLFN